MPTFATHHVQFGVFAGVFAIVTVVGFLAARWRRPQNIHTLEEWGLGGRAFGNWVTWFLLSGDIYTAYTFVAIPTLMYGIGAGGFFAIPFLVILYPLLFVLLPRFWSVAHVNGYVTPAEFVRNRYGSPGLGLLVAATGILATMPYIALQLVGIQAVFRVMGVPGPWPLTIAFAVLAVYTFISGLRGPALISIIKDALIMWTVLGVILMVVTTSGGWAELFHSAGAKFAATPNLTDGLTLAPSGQLSYVTLAVGSAFALFLYPHTLTGTLAARNRNTIKRNLVALPVYTLMLGFLALLGYAAISAGVQPIGGDRNTIVPRLLDSAFPAWSSGLALAAIGVGAMVPAAIMSIGSANLFTRDIYRVFIRPDATPAREARVSRTASLTTKLGALLVIALFNTQFAIDMQLVGGVLILQTLPAFALGLRSAWAHRWALAGGLVAGLTTGLIMLYQIPQLGGADGHTILRAHFGGSAWPLSHLGLHTSAAVYAGVLALVVNLVVTVVATPVLHRLGVPAGVDATRPEHYVADEGDASVQHMTELLDGARLPAADPVSMGTWTAAERPTRV
ncbi:MAG: sodium:solute symporter [Actinobacteria bacterium 13_1_20CM_3_71_11]|nr:MAG: sodium:solute symporter [Actinobacteria bacterium 13_1_20CM_3_71_11]